MKDSNKGKQPQNGRSPQQLSRGEARAAVRAWPGTATSAGPVVSPHLGRPLLLSLSPPLPLSSLSTYRPPAQDSLLPSLLPGVQEPPFSELHKTGHYQHRHLRTRPYTTSQLRRAQPPPPNPQLGPQLLWEGTAATHVHLPPSESESSPRLSGRCPPSSWEPWGPLISP